LALDAKGKPLPKDPKTKENSKAVQGRAVDVKPDGKRIAVGTRDGTLIIYETN